jgi:hypothetical protein
MGRPLANISLTVHVRWGHAMLAESGCAASAQPDCRLRRVCFRFHGPEKPSSIGKAFLLIQAGHWAVPTGAPADRVGLPGSSTAVGL